MAKSNKAKADQDKLDKKKAEDDAKILSDAKKSKKIYEDKLAKLEADEQDRLEVEAEVKKEAEKKAKEDADVEAETKAKQIKMIAVEPVLHDGEPIVPGGSFLADKKQSVRHLKNKTAQKG